ncbi:VWA domain-containing protein [Nocardia cyriacigeorgica]|jgi:Mg-chelatase subunit ChlD|uniref:VWA domain-containing protein n=1 Tax=Nocardia cyriacigeorgica TaxID=135487 RepID=UPI0003002BE3|nr:VWA domain-containing protein [Nocardia cyriacigeorgica]AVH22481.1 VWA domain-containing protein [Nocardia cyriacigeorgica]MBF6322114.1 VWA domain-containing protein [Nocardia cyriacigeorgica]MBF6497841.1 VWA domain-containing protein [Nocardia cyriacigeorgica]PPJ14731.1 VWA domain-containing protein [Nocardia cyriacigeorgica]TLF53920.1 VWA domain-containing protein [Nocardia cyriacigeorgica]
MNDTPDRTAAEAVDGESSARRWRLVLGAAAEPELGGLGSADDAAMDGALSTLYDSDPPAGAGPRSAGLQGSAPRVARWLGDIRTYFPSSVVEVMQRDAIERLDLTQLLLEPELLEAVEPDVHLVGTLLGLNRVMPETTRSTARMVVERVVRDIERRMAARTVAAVSGALDRAARVSRPRPRDIDWDRTIRKNLAHYLPEQRTVVPERLVGYGRRAKAVRRDVVLAIDQSGSMASSVVYASVFGAVLASMRSLRTSLVVFDTEVVDLTEHLSDPVDVLFGTQLGGGTDINRALAYCQTLVTRPEETLFVLISDLYEGGIRDDMLRRVNALKESGVQVLVLLALSDDGAPAYDHDNAAALDALGIPAFACTPDRFPDLLALALNRGDIRTWANTTTGRS